LGNDENCRDFCSYIDRDDGTVIIEVLIIEIFDVYTYEGRGDIMTDYHDDLRTDCGYIYSDDCYVIDDN
jgi:hypothetical protein